MPNLLKNKMNIVNIICILLLVALIVVLIICLVKNNENFGEHHEESISMCTRQGCGFAKRAEDLIKKNGMKIMDKHVKFVNTESPECAGVNGTPTFIYKGNQVAGYHEDLNELHDKLTKSNESKSGNNNNKNNGDKNILFIGSMRCPFCIKAKKKMDEMQLDYKFVESNSPEGNENMTKHNMNGVPLIINLRDDIIIKGYDENKIKQLKN